MKNNTINKKEIEKFSRIADEWWNPTGKFKPLHKFNPIRIKYIKENLIEHFSLKKNNKPLKKLRNFRYWLWGWIAFRTNVKIRCQCNWN